eukprot:CAMPEP_0170189620 /NCGR_PEP_ID=MMETSP0040_2-20121228/47286_1 /TAXON_ID=641309 /ORGANISM="Lotharella oceanica, Strain CCMP622" /LENGTH=368 /DNA_ID=CAMNT_0010437243 /DNA_START=355 /DNA_END=1461 /DNA_ORIENTATION=+
MDRFSEWHIARIVQQIAQALRYLHAKGIVHRDLKPENIMFALPYLEGKEEQHLRSLKLTDFGFAVHLEKGYATSSRGTPNYMAPETVFKAPNMESVVYGSSCDMWALGVILYELIAGRSPFPLGMVKTKADLPEFFKKIIETEIVFEPVEWGGTSPELKNIVLGLLRKDPCRRFNARQVLRHRWITRQCSIASKQWESHLSQEEILRSRKTISNRQSRVRAMIGRKKLMKAVLYLSLMARLRDALQSILKSSNLEADVNLKDFVFEMMDNGDNWTGGADQGSSVVIKRRPFGVLEEPLNNVKMSLSRRVSIAALKNAEQKVRWSHGLGSQRLDASFKHHRRSHSGGIPLHMSPNDGRNKQLWGTNPAL